MYQIQFDPQMINKEWVDPKIAERHGVLPLYKNCNRLFVAISDPSNLAALEAVRFKTSLVVDPVVVEHDKLGQAIAKVTKTTGKEISDLVTDDDFDIDLETGNKATEGESNPDVDDAPVVRMRAICG